jgi:hypothetical protein
MLLLQHQFVLQSVVVELLLLLEMLLLDHPFQSKFHLF